MARALVLFAAFVSSTRGNEMYTSLCCGNSCIAVDIRQSRGSLYLRNNDSWVLVEDNALRAQMWTHGEDVVLFANGYSMRGTIPMAKNQPPFLSRSPLVKLCERVVKGEGLFGEDEVDVYEKPNHVMSNCRRSSAGSVFADEDGVSVCVDNCTTASPSSGEMLDVAVSRLVEEHEMSRGTQRASGYNTTETPKKAAAESQIEELLPHHRIWIRENRQTNAALWGEEKVAARGNFCLQILTDQLATAPSEERHDARG